jgi:fatty acid-binding protein DegV
MERVKIGETVPNIVTSLKEISKKNETYVLVGNLVQLYRSGRLNNFQYLMGSMLNIKPVLMI